MAKMHQPPDHLNEVLLDFINQLIDEVKNFRELIHETDSSVREMKIRQGSMSDDFDKLSEQNIVLRLIRLEDKLGEYKLGSELINTLKERLVKLEEKAKHKDMFWKDYKSWLYVVTLIGSLIAAWFSGFKGIPDTRY